MFNELLPKKFGDLMFGVFYPKFLNCIFTSTFAEPSCMSLKYEQFKANLSRNINSGIY